VSIEKKGLPGDEIAGKSYEKHILFSLGMPAGRRKTIDIVGRFAYIEE
jgi:hypothetical protein